MTKVIATTIAALALVLSIAPAATAQDTPPLFPPDPAPAECQPWIDPLTYQIDQYRQGIASLLRTEDELFATIRADRDEVARLTDRLQMRRWKIRQQAHDLRGQAREIRRLRAQVQQLQG